MRQKSSSGKWRSRQNVASGGKGSKGSGGKELRQFGELHLHRLKIKDLAPCKFKSVGDEEYQTNHQTN